MIPQHHVELYADWVIELGPTVVSQLKEEKDVASACQVAADKHQDEKGELDDQIVHHLRPKVIDRLATKVQAELARRPKLPRLEARIQALKAASDRLAPVNGDENEDVKAEVAAVREQITDFFDTWRDRTVRLHGGVIGRLTLPIGTIMENDGSGEVLVASPAAAPMAIVDALIAEGARIKADGYTGHLELGWDELAEDGQRLIQVVP